MNRLLIPVVLTGLLLGLSALSGCAATDPEVAGAQRHLEAGEFNQALQSIERALQTDPTNVDAYDWRGRIYGAMAEEMEPGPERTEAIENMMEAYNRVRELDPGNQLVEVRLLQHYAAEMNRGADAWERGREDPEQFAHAARAFGHASLINPDSLNPYYFQGMAYLAAGETEAAAPALREAVDRDIREAEPYHYLGQIYLAQDRADEAITVLERGAELFPDNVDLRSDLLNAYARIGDIDRALEAYAQIVADQPNNALLRYNYGSFLLQSGYYDEATEHLTRAVELEPFNAEAHYNLGAAYLNEAIELHEQMVELEPDSPEAIQLVARRDNLLEEAISPLSQARALFEEPHNIEDACSGLFRAYALLRMDAEAREAAACAGIDLD